MQHKVHELMIDVIRSEQTEENHETAIWFMGNLCVDLPEVKQALTESGLVKRISEILMEKPNTNNTFARNVCWTLGNFMKSDSIEITH